MTSYFTGFAVAALLIIGPALPGHAEDAAPAAPAATQTEAAPESVARPSLVPKAAEPASPAAANSAPRRQRRYAHRQHRRHGYHRAAYWQPLPIYWPQLHRSRIHWNRISRMLNF